MSHAHAAVAGEHKPHVLPLRIYFSVWGALLVLTYLTVAASYQDFGTWNLVVAVGIATIKASLVALFFMHLKYDERFNALIFVSALAFLGIFFILTLADTSERGSVDPIKAYEIAPVPGRPDLEKRLGPGEHGMVIDTTAAASDSGKAAADSAGAAGGMNPGGGKPGGGNPGVTKPTGVTKPGGAGNRGAAADSGGASPGH